MMTECIVCGNKKFLAIHSEQRGRKEHSLWVCTGCHRKIHAGLINLPLPEKKDKEVWSVS